MKTAMYPCQINFPVWVKANNIGYSLSCCVPEMKEKHIDGNNVSLRS